MSIFGGSNASTSATERVGAALSFWRQKRIPEGQKDIADGLGNLWILHSPKMCDGCWCIVIDIRIKNGNFFFLNGLGLTVHTSCTYIVRSTLFSAKVSFSLATEPLIQLYDLRIFLAEIKEMNQILIQEYGKPVLFCFRLVST